MILKESLFNKGVFNTVLRRFRLGSLLYFIILFLCVPTMFLTRSPEVLESRYFGRIDIDYTIADSALFSTDMLILPVLVTMLVPTVAALLIFNYIHSPRHAIFTHSMPVSRKANYFSSLCGGLTLMALPVVINAIILIIISLLGYGKVVGLIPSLVWMLVFLAVIFIMFSVATLASFLAGNPFSAAAINLIIHLIPFMLAASVSFFGDRYLYGFANDNEMFENMLMGSPLINLFTNLLGGDVYYFFKNMSVWVFLVVSIVLFVLSYFLYKYRKVELSGDVAGFKIMHPILKYTLCSGAFILSFAIFTSIEISAIWYFLLTGIITAIVYFASEMVLKKNLRIFHLYKGLIGFFAAAAVVLSFLAFTSVFGFETRIPKEEKIESVALYTDYNDEVPYVKDPRVIKTATEHHRKFIKDIPALKKDSFYYTEEIYTADSLYTEAEKPHHTYTVMLNYRLKSGKVISRRYRIENEAMYKMLSALFESKEYKVKKTGIDEIIFDNVKKLDIRTNCGDLGFDFTLYDKSPEFLRALKKDIENITYDDYYTACPVNIYASLDASPEDNKTEKIFKESAYPYHYYHFSISINPNFKNAYNFLLENGYIEQMKSHITDNLYVSKEPVYFKSGTYTFNGENFNPDSVIHIGTEFLRKLSPEESEKAYEEILLKKYNQKEIPFSENYYLFCANTTHMENGTSAANNIARFSPDTMPEFLK